MNPPDNPTPTKSTTETSPASAPAEINQQTGLLAWKELEKHFARGVVINVDATLDLVKVAQSMSVDNTEQIQTWLDAGTIRRACDDDAREWSRDNPEFWCVVVAPWVLVQRKG